MNHVDGSVYVITDRRAAGERSLLDVVRAAVRGGATVVQLRDKDASTRDMIQLGQALLAITRPAGVPLIVNDRVDVALAIGAEGVHVGQDDMPAATARALIGPDCILGVSATTVEEARQAERDGADYIGAGDVHGTPSKPDAGPPIGLAGLAQIADAVSRPVVAIGGITLENAAATLQAGAVGLAVISAVVGAGDPEAAARRLHEIASASRARGAREVQVIDIRNRAADMLARIHAEKPLLHHITNMVVMNDTANLTLHLGALPVMAHAVEEMAEMTGLASALVLNIGTLTPAWVEAMLAAGHKANEKGIPIVLDPVGAGATRLRTETSLHLLDELDIAVIRGNSGEIGALSGAGGVVRGVESVKGVQDPVAVAKTMAVQWNTVVAITGKRDVLSDGRRVLGVDNGHLWLTTVTGTGCMATTTIAAFAAVERDYLLATAGALACYGFAAERAAESARGPASFKVALLDHVYNLTPGELAAGARIVTLEPAGQKEE
jgi:hydroxyethylthiazole kinase/thiamine-phosphate diphosphorylase